MWFVSPSLLSRYQRCQSMNVVEIEWAQLTYTGEGDVGQGERTQRQKSAGKALNGGVGGDCAMTEPCEEWPWSL
jgi:hypothetical protein